MHAEGADGLQRGGVVVGEVGDPTFDCVSSEELLRRRARVLSNTSIRATSSSASYGFPRKSSAPLRNPSTRAFTVFFVLTISTGR